jgi:hypothetical protein
MLSAAHGRWRSWSNGVANREYIERLQLVIRQLHKCDSRHLKSVPVHEVFQGKTVWRGEVEVFSVTGHSKATRCYAWSHRDGRNDEGERFVTVLGLPPVDSPAAAVKVAVASEIRSKTLDKNTKT